MKPLELYSVSMDIPPPPLPGTAGRTPAPPGPLPCCSWPALPPAWPTPAPLGATGEHSLFGSPRKFLSDNGGELNNSEMRDLGGAFNIKIKTTSAESPWINGSCERLNAVVTLGIFAVGQFDVNKNRT